MQFSDAVEVSGATVRADGYLVADSFALRTGIQRYLGSEVGRPDLEYVDVYRPEDEVFAKDSLSSLSHAPVTDDHPAQMVSAENWHDLAKGEVSAEVLRSGDRLRIPLIVKDKATVEKVMAGKRQLSAGYMAALEWGDGVTEDGQAYQAKQTKIRFNHLAIVDRARAGDEFRIGDSAADGGKDRTSWGAAPVSTPMADTKERAMPPENLHTVVLGDQAVQVADKDAPVIERFKADAASQRDKLVNDHKEAIAAKDKEIADKDAKIEKLEKDALSDADLDKRVQSRAKLVSDAQKVSKDVKTEGVTDADIRKAVVRSKLGDEKVEGKSDDYIGSRFDHLVEAVEANDSATDPLRSNGAIPANDGGSNAWGDGVLAGSGVKLKKEA